MLVLFVTHASTCEIRLNWVSPHPVIVSARKNRPHTTPVAPGVERMFTAVPDADRLCPSTSDIS